MNNWYIYIYTHIIYIYIFRHHIYIHTYIYIYIYIFNIYIYIISCIYVYCIIPYIYICICCYWGWTEFMWSPWPSHRVSVPLPGRRKHRRRRKHLPNEFRNLVARWGAKQLVLSSLGCPCHQKWMGLLGMAAFRLWSRVICPDLFVKDGEEAAGTFRSLEDVLLMGPTSLDGWIDEWMDGCIVAIHFDIETFETCIWYHLMWLPWFLFFPTESYSFHKFCSGWNRHQVDVLGESHVVNVPKKLTLKS